MSRPNLQRWLAAQSDAVSADEAADFVRKLAEAVHYAHQAGVVHRDIKPSNILLEPKTADSGDSLSDFEPKITDFGLAKWIHGQLQTHDSLLIGTPLYMAPEQLLSSDSLPGDKADIYSLGVLLFELLTLRTPFAGESYIEIADRLRGEQAPRLRTVRSDVPRDLELICAKCLEKDPSDRFDSAASLADELRRFAADEPIQTAPPSAASRLLRWCRQSRRLVAAGRFTLALQLILVIWVLVNLVTVLAFGLVSPDVVARSTRDLLFVTFTMHLSKAFLGWMLIRARRWAFWPSALTSLVMIVIFVHGALSNAVAFDYNYPTPLSKVQVFSLLIMACAWDAALHLLAIPAWLVGAKRDGARFNEH